MKHYITSLLTLLVFCVTTDAVGQSLYVDYPSLRYVHNGKNAGDMTFTGGKTLTIEGMAHNISDINSISFSTETMTDSTVTVVYSGSTAQVTVSGAIARYMNVTVNGAHVKIIQDEQLQRTVKYTLSGASTDGSFYMDGEFKAEFTLDNLTLNNPDSATINIQDGKKIYVNLVGTNTLTDNAGGSHNACMYIDGHPEFTGTGTLNVTGNTKHGISTDEHMIMTSGTVNILSAVNDGMHVSEYFQMDGGTIKINAKGDGIDVGFKGVNKGTKNQYAKNGMVFINGGLLTIETSGTATKGLKCDSTMTIAGGTTTVTTTGSAYYDTTEKDISCPTAIKPNGAFVMTNGTVSLLSTGDAGRALNAGESLTISGGTMLAVTTGDIFEYGTSDSAPHALKSGTDINITGGNVYVFASAEDGVALKQDKTGTTSVSGGIVLVAGGKTSDMTSTQYYKKYTRQKLTAGTSITYDNVSYTVPSKYSNSSAVVQVSRPQ